MKISVIIPAFNEADYLDACLDSLARQTRKADEIIVVDNNSADRTAIIAGHYDCKVIQEKKQGIWPASSTGYDHATGDIIARCDADSVLPPNWLAKIDDAFRSDESLSAITGPGVFHDTNRVIRVLADMMYMKAYFFSVGLALGYPPLFGSNFAMKKSVWLHATRHAHSDRTDIHDDIDLSYHVPPGAMIRYDASLVVSISARPFYNVRGMLQRSLRGLRSIYIHWPEQAPWRRYLQNRSRS